MTDFGIIGVGRIGTSLARNMSSNGIKVSLYDKSFDTSTDIKTHYSELESSLVFDDINKFISSITDLYSLDLNQLLSLEGFAEKSAKNLIDSISKSKETELYRFIYSLGIKEIGLIRKLIINLRA